MALETEWEETPLVTLINLCISCMPPANSHGVGAEFLQCAKLFSLHTLVVSVKLFKEFDDRVKKWEEPVP